MIFFFFKQKTAYEMRISDLSSDVCSSDLSKRATVTLNRLSALVLFVMNDILRTERTAMASDAPVENSGSHSQRAAFAAIDTLRHKALEKLTLAMAKAVESASDDTLADIVGSEDLRHALVIAPRDIAPQAPADLEAIRAARERTAQFREEMAERAGGMFDRRSEEHTSELQSLMRISYAVFCLKKKKKTQRKKTNKN